MSSGGVSNVPFRKYELTRRNQELAAHRIGATNALTPDDVVAHLKDAVVYIPTHRAEPIGVFKNRKEAIRALEKATGRKVVRDVWKATFEGWECITEGSSFIGMIWIRGLKG